MAFGFLGKIAKGIGKVGGKVLGAAGDVVKTAAPALSFIPGVGTIAATGLGALGGGLGTLNDPGANFGNFLGNAAKGGLRGGLGGLAKGALGKLGGLKGLGGLAGKLGIGGSDGIDIGDILKFGGGAALAGLSAKEQADARKAAEARQAAMDELLRRQMTLGEEEFASRAPLRQAGQQAALKFLSGPTRGIFQTPRTAGELTGGVTQELQGAESIVPPSLPTSPAPIRSGGELAEAVRTNPRALTGLKGIAGLAKRFAQGRGAGGSGTSSGGGGGLSPLARVNERERLL